MNKLLKDYWNWKGHRVAWQKSGDSTDKPLAILLIHGFGACKEHWRNNQKVLGKLTTCYSLDLIGFGESSQPKSCLKQEVAQDNSFNYSFDNWSEQIIDFCQEIIKKPVVIVGNSIGGVIALNASKSIQINCKGLILIDCAQRTMDDKRLNEQPLIMRFLRPFIKNLVSRRIISKTVFQNAARPSFIEKILKIAYPSGSNIDKELIDILYRPTQRKGADEAFRGFINLFDDHLAPDLMKELNIPIDLIWGENDPWEKTSLAQDWYSNIKSIRSLKIIPEAGHCPHDEKPEQVNKIISSIIQEAIYE